MLPFVPETYNSLSTPRLRNDTTIEWLRESKKSLELKLDQINKAIELVESEPKLADFLQAIEVARSGF